MTNCDKGTAGTVHPECIGEQHYSDEHGTGSAIKEAKAPDVDLQKQSGGGAMPSTRVEDALEKATYVPLSSTHQRIADILNASSYKPKHGSWNAQKVQNYLDKFTREGSIPPEFQQAMDRAREGANDVRDRYESLAAHEQARREPVIQDNLRMMELRNPQDPHGFNKPATSNASFSDEPKPQLRSYQHGSLGWDDQSEHAKVRKKNEDKEGAEEQNDHEHGEEKTQVSKHPVKVVSERELPPDTKVHDSGWKVPETVGGDSNAPGLTPAWESETARQVPADVLADLENKRKKAEEASKAERPKKDKPADDKPKAKKEKPKPKEKPEQEDDKMDSPQKNLDSFTKSDASPIPSIRDLMKAAEDGREFAYPSGFRPKGANFDGRIHPYQELYRTVHMDRDMPAMPDMDRVKRVRN